MGSYIVRAVDSGNIQRSPTFQAIFSYAFSESADLPFRITFDSAGIDVDNIMSDSTPAAKKLGIIDAGLCYDVIHGRNKSVALDLVNRWHQTSDEKIPEKEKTIITRVYSEIKTKVHTIQMEYRNRALIEVGIPPKFLPGMRIPFRHDKNLLLVLPVEKSIVQKVQDYYKNLKNTTLNTTSNGDMNDVMPAINLYGDLVGVEPLKDDLKGGMDTARKQVKYFMDTRHKAINEIKNILANKIERRCFSL